MSAVHRLHQRVLLTSTEQEDNWTRILFSLLHVLSLNFSLLQRGTQSQDSRQGGLL